MNKKLIAIISVAMMSFLVMSGCSSNDSAGGGDKSPSNSETILLWDYLGQDTPNEAMAAAISEFEKQNDGVKVERKSFAYQDLSKSIVQAGIGGEVPDIAIFDNVDTQNFASLNLLADISEQTSGMKDEFFEGPWSSGQQDSKTYSLPLNSNNLALFYNLDMLDKAGVKVPTNWQELADAAKATATDGNFGLAISAVKNEQASFQVLPFIWQTGGDLDNYAESGAKALEYLRGIIESGAMSKSVTNYSQEDARTQFVTGKAAMMFNGPWEIPNVGKDADFKWGIAPLPKGQVAATGLGGENIGVFANAKNKEGAVKLLKYLAGAEGSKIYCDISGQLSSRKDLAGKLKFSSDEKMQVFEKQLQVAKARAYGGKYSEISAALQLSIQEALTGAKTAKEAAQTAADVIKPLLSSK